MKNSDAVIPNAEIEVFHLKPKKQPKMISGISLVVLLAFIVSLILLLLLFYCKNGDFYSNLLPELIGFCLDGIFFVMLVSFRAPARTRASPVLQSRDEEYLAKQA